MKDVNQLLFEMFTENTGRHMLDSGGAYGRNWERNQKLTFEDAMNLPEVTHEVNEWKDGECEVDITVNVFKYLVSANLELDKYCEEFNRLNYEAKDWNCEELYGVSHSAGKYLKVLPEIDIKDSWNTYNDTYQILSQVLQGCYLEINGEDYVLLQIHGGCDVRGGYTDAKLFKLNDWSEGYLPLTDIFGHVDGVQVDNMYDGYNLTNEEGEEVEIKTDSIIELELMPR